MTAQAGIQRVTHIRAGAGASWWVAGDTYTFKVTGDDTDGRFTVLEASVPPQAGPPPHVHQIEDEAYYMLEGELEMLDHDRVITLRAGEFVYIPHGTRHAFKNTGTTSSRMLVFITPAGFENFLFEVGQPAKPGEMAPPLEPAEMERTAALAPRYGLELHVPAEA